MKKVIFREYDIRGVVGKDFIIEETPRLVHAIISHLQQQGLSNNKIVVGYDGRASSPQIAALMINTLVILGYQVIAIGLAPSPVAYFAGYHHQAAVVLMITASHNPASYNGIKVVRHTHPVWGEELQCIYGLYEINQQAISVGKGNVENSSIIPIYIDYLYKQFQSLHQISSSIVFDCAYAAAGVVIPALVEKFGWENAYVLHAEIGGSVDHIADPIVPENVKQMRQVILEQQCDYGIAFDGDADRMAVITNEGKLLTGDILLALFMKGIKGKTPLFSVVCNVTMSQMLFDYAAKLGLHMIMSPTGHALIESSMQKHNALLGGESSCHFFFKDRYFGYDDGIYAALRYMELVSDSNGFIQPLLDELPRYYISREYRIACSDDEKRSIVALLTELYRSRANVTLITIDGVRVIYPEGWAIVRAANTQPVLSIRAEGITQNALVAIMSDLVAMMKQCAPHISMEALLEG